MAAVHFITIACEPNTTRKATFFAVFAYAGFEGFRTFLYVFMSVFKVSVR